MVELTTRKGFSWGCWKRPAWFSLRLASFGVGGGRLLDPSVNLTTLLFG